MSVDNQQTAVEWLIEELEMNILWTDKAIKAVQQAKKMEKEQIIEACKQCSYSYEEAEQYYNETFKSE